VARLAVHIGQVVCLVVERLERLAARRLRRRRKVVEQRLPRGGVQASRLRDHAVQVEQHGIEAQALPIAAILGLMLGLQWSAARAGVAGLALTLMLVRWPFRYGIATYPHLGYGPAVGGAMAEAAFTAVTILWIIFPALCIYHLQVVTGRIERIRAAVAAVSDDPRIGVLVIVWFFALFMEGAAGFGTPVALAAPLLVTVGVRPLRAVAAVLIAHSVGVSFGAVGTPIGPQAAATGLAPAALAHATGVYHVLIGWVMLLLAMRTAMPDSQEETTGRAMLRWNLAAAALFLLPMFAIARWVGPELPTLGGALIGGLGFVLLAQLAVGGRPPQAHRDSAGLVMAAAPYVVLIALVLMTRLVDPIRAIVTSVTLEWRALDLFSGRIQPLYHPGTMLTMGFLVGGLLQRVTVAELATAAARAARQLQPVLLALLMMLGISRLMVHAGMIGALAQSGAALGALWPLGAPFVGVLGTFVTGSATASNILMTDLQRATAESLSLPPLILVSAQGFGAAVGNIIAPHNIIAGCATVALSGREGDVLGRTLGPCLLYASLGGVLTMVLIRMG
jgi:lactate permease